MGREHGQRGTGRIYEITVIQIFTRHGGRSSLRRHALHRGGRFWRRARELLLEERRPRLLQAVPTCVHVYERRRRRRDHLLHALCICELLGLRRLRLLLLLLLRVDVRVRLSMRERRGVWLLWLQGM